MSQLVESLKRLFGTDKLTEAMIRDLFNRGKITSQEYVYITQKD